MPAAQWTGFHPMEKTMWIRRTTSGLGSLADRLQADVKDLQRRVRRVKLEPAQIANGSVELLGEVSKSKITGEEERYSHTDLDDFQANVDGSRTAYESVRRIVAAKKPALAAEIDRRFDDVDQALAPYRRADRVRLVHRADGRGHSQAQPGDRRPGRAALARRLDRRHRIGMGSPRLTRRGLIAGAGAVGAGLALGGVELERALGDSSGGSAQIPFHGDHQAGIATAAQDRLHFAAFDVTADRRSDLRDLLRVWTEAAERMTAGELVGEVDQPAAPPVDTGEALGLPPARLTVTFGLGPTLFDERFGLASRRPAELTELPPLPGDELDPSRSGGDLCVQACADDPQVVFHAVRNLARIGRGAVVMRWSQLGFGRTSTTSRSQATPRNLMGFKDGTNNLKLEDGQALAQHVWVGAGDRPEWLRGGTYLVARRIRMLIEVWDRASLADQEDTIGRVKDSGAPLGEHAEFDPVDLASKRIPTDAHIRLAAPSTNGGIKILRRGYSFTDGMDERLGQLDAGLFFISFQRHPAAFVELQRRLGGSDALNEYIVHTGSGLFAVPPGVRPGGYVGQSLLG